MSSKCRITGWQKEKMIQIGAGQAPGTLVFNQRDPGAPTKLLPALVAGRIGRRDEYFQLYSLLHPRACLVLPFSISCLAWCID